MVKRSRKTKKIADMSEDEVRNLASTEVQKAEGVDPPVHVVEPTNQPFVETLEVPVSQSAFEAAVDDLGETPQDAEVLDQEEQRGVEEGEIPDDEPEKVVTSVVAAKYKDLYISNANANGLKGKAAKRSNWDWLSQKLADYCLAEKQKIDIQRFKDILGANGVDYSKWTNQSKGWEGRFRMTGRVVLQKVVANQGFLVLADGDRVEAPEAFIAKYKTKA